MSTVVAKVEKLKVEVVAAKSIVIVLWKMRPNHIMLECITPSMRIWMKVVHDTTVRIAAAHTDNLKTDTDYKKEK